MLDRDDPPRGERPAVPDPVDLVDDRDRGITRAQEVGVQRVHVPVGRHRTAGRDQRLAGDLAAEDPLHRLVRAEAAEDVHLELLEIEDREQRAQFFSHGGRL